MRSDRNIPTRDRHGDASGLCRMLELLVAPYLRNFEPSVCFQLLDDVPAVHIGAFVDLSHDTHFIHTEPAFELDRQPRLISTKAAQRRSSARRPPTGPCARSHAQ